MKIAKNILWLGIIPTIMLGMEPAQKKRCVESFNSDYIERQLVRAEQTHRLKLDGGGSL